MRYRALLLAILTLAAVLRFTGLSWGLRHQPTWDERVFVHSTRAMITKGDLDHRYYEYPGLFFYLLYPVLASVPSESESGTFYLAARALVAAFSVASVALTYLLGARLAGPGSGSWPPRSSRFRPWKCRPLIRSGLTWSSKRLP